MKKLSAASTAVFISLIFCVAALAEPGLKGTWICFRDEGAGIIWTYRLTFGGNSAIFEERAGAAEPKLTLVSYIVNEGTIDVTLRNGWLKGEHASMPYTFSAGRLILTMDKEEEPYVFEREE